MSMAVTAKRMALILAWIGLALSVAACVASIRLTRSSDLGSGFYYFMGVPLIVAMLAVAASRGGSVGPLWAAIGAMAGVVIAGAWSIGAFFEPAAVALLVA